MPSIPCRTPLLRHTSVRSSSLGSIRSSVVFNHHITAALCSPSSLGMLTAEQHRGASTLRVDPRTMETLMRNMQDAEKRGKKTEGARGSSGASSEVAGGGGVTGDTEVIVHRGRKTVVFPCPHCPKRFESKTTLNMHLIKKHGDHGGVRHGKFVICSVCTKSFASEVDLSMHMVANHSMDSGSAEAAATGGSSSAARGGAQEQGGKEAGGQATTASSSSEPPKTAASGGENSTNKQQQQALTGVLGLQKPSKPSKWTGLRYSSGSTPVSQVLQQVQGSEGNSGDQPTTSTTDEGKKERAEVDKKGDGDTRKMTIRCPLCSELVESGSMKTHFAAVHAMPLEEKFQKRSNVAREATGAHGTVASDTGNNSAGGEESEDTIQALREEEAQLKAKALGMRFEVQRAKRKLSENEHQNITDATMGADTVDDVPDASTTNDAGNLLRTPGTIAPPSQMPVSPTETPLGTRSFIPAESQPTDLQPVVSIGFSAAATIVGEVVGDVATGEEANGTPYADVAVAVEAAEGEPSTTMTIRCIGLQNQYYCSRVVKRGFLVHAFGSLKPGQADYLVRVQPPGGSLSVIFGQTDDGRE